MRWVLVVLLAACGESGPASPAVGGRVLTVGGEAVPGATVEIRALDSALPVKGATDDDGRFALKLLSRGQLEITVRHPALAEPHVERLEGEPDDVTIHVRPVATVHGRVVDARGAPIAGADVVVRTSRRPTARAKTDEDGRYVVAAPRRAGLAPPEAAAAAPGCLPRAARPERVETLLGQPRYGMPDLVLTFCGYARGRVVAPDGLPVAGAEVRLLAIGVSLSELGWSEVPERLPELGRFGAGSHYRDDPFSYVSVRGVTDVDGSYALTVPPPDRVLIVIASRPGGPPRRLDLTEVDLERPLPDLEVPPLCGIRVQVVKPDGAPLTPAFVRLSWPYPNIPLGVWSSEQIESDAQGRVTLPCAEPGVAYDVWILGGGGTVKLENHVLDPAKPLVGGKR